jgi:hypothetical protein
MATHFNRQAAVSAAAIHALRSEFAMEAKKLFAVESWTNEMIVWAMKTMAISAPVTVSNKERP